VLEQHAIERKVPERLALVLFALKGLALEWSVPVRNAPERELLEREAGEQQALERELQAWQARETRMP
jgi:hypothetical protein